MNVENLRRATRRAGLVVLLLTAPAPAALASEGLGAFDSLAEAPNTFGLCVFLDEQGQLSLPPGFSGSLNPAGFDLVSGQGEAPRFATATATQGATPPDNARWAGGFPLPNGCNGEISAIATGSAGEIYLGGEFTLCGYTPPNNVVRYDSITGTWSALGSDDGNGVSGSVNALTVSGTDLYVGGEFIEVNVGADVPANRIARWDGSAWNALGSGGGNGVTDSVFALAVSGTNVYVGGDFTQVNVGADSPANRVARWDGSVWSVLGSGGGNGLDDSVFALVVSGNELYVGGAFFQANVGAAVAANGIARWNGSGWSALGSGGGDGVLGSIRALTVSGSDLYVGGNFTQVNAGTDIPANRVARWDGSAWTALGNGVGLSSVRALAVTEETILSVGGNFGSAGGNPASHLDRYTIASPLQLSALPATVLVGNASVISTSGGFGSGKISVELSSGAAFCSLIGSTLTALAQGECIVTSTKASGVFPEQNDSVLVRTVTVPGSNLAVNFSALPPGDAMNSRARGPCLESDFRVSVRNNGSLDAAEVRLQMPSPSGLLSPVAWFCVLGDSQCTPEMGFGAVDATFTLDVGALAEIDLLACPDPDAAFADFQFQASLPNGTLLFPAEAQGSVSVPLNNEGLFRSGFE